MHSLNGDSWTNVADFETRVICIKSGMFVNGKLLWANHTSGSDIISFDLVEKTWGEVEQPLLWRRRFLLDTGSFGK